MINKRDIYKKPSIAYKEIAARIFVVIVFLFFFSAELYNYLTPPTKKQLSEIVEEFNQTHILHRAKEKECQTEETLLSNTFKITQEVEKAPILVTQIKVPHKIEKEETPIVEKETVQAPVIQTVTPSMKLLQAIKDDNLAEVKELVTAQKDFNTSGVNVHKMIEHRQYKIASLLIDHDIVNVNDTNKQGRTILHQASIMGHGGLIRLIASKGADINAQSINGVSALHYPVRQGYKKTITRLLDLGINPNLKATYQVPGLYWNQTTPLLIAAKQGRVSVFKQLIEHGADINAVDGDGKTMLDLAKKFKQEDMINYLLTLPEFKPQEPLGASEPVDQNLTHESSTLESNSSSATL